MMERAKGVNKHGKKGVKTYKTLMRQNKEMQSQVSKAFTEVTRLQRFKAAVVTSNFTERFRFLCTKSIGGWLDDQS